MSGRLLLLEQANRETEKWKRLLDRLQQKNIVQKYHLAEMLRNGHRPKDRLVVLAEQYQNQFLQQDEALKLMRNDIAALERLLLQAHEVKNQRENIYRHKKKLEKEMKAFRANFKRLSLEFSIFLVSVGSLCL